jgi:aminopeptidase
VTTVSTSEAPAEASLLAPERLERYAETVVRSCLGLGDGETLYVVGHPAHRQFLVAVAEAGYRAGAKLVDVDYFDPLVQAARIRHAREEDLGPMPAWKLKKLRAQLDTSTAQLSVIGEADPGAFDGLPVDRVVTDAQRPLRKLGWMIRATRENRRRWAVAAWPTPAWAAQVYPELDSPDAQCRLADDLLWFCRLGPDDPPGAEGWERHVDILAQRAQALTELKLARVELRGPGTELDVRLAPGTRWLGGREENAAGQLVAPNFPTEENFTSPDARGTEGTFRCSRLLAFRGHLIEGLAGEFRNGRLVRLEAAREDERDLVSGFLASDRNAGRLGEVALVDRSSRIGRTDRVYSNTLIDENAAAHIAFGLGFGQTRLPDPSARGVRGVNNAKLHLDVMIGTDDFDATGITASGKRVPLLVDGTWQIPG